MKTNSKLLDELVEYTVKFLNDNGLDPLTAKSVEKHVRQHSGYIDFTHKTARDPTNRKPPCWCTCHTGNYITRVQVFTSVGEFNMYVSGGVVLEVESDSWVIP